MIVLTAIILLTLHTLDGREVEVNSSHIVSLAEKSPHVTANVGCTVNLLDGKFLAVTERCVSIRKQLEAVK